MQGAEDVEENTESTHSSLHLALSHKFPELIVANNRHEKCNLSNPRIKIENHQEKASSTEEETSPKEISSHKGIFSYA